MSRREPPSDPGPSERSPDTSDGGGFVPYRDPVVLTLVVVLLGTLVVAVAGLSAGPVLSDDDGNGSVFPVGELLNDSSRDRVSLRIDLNRSNVTVGDPVGVRVTDPDGNPVPSARVRVTDQQVSVDADGRAVVVPSTAGETVVSATAPATNDTVYRGASTSLSVDRRTVRLTLSTNESRVLVDDPLAVRLRRADTDAPVAGTVSIDDRSYDLGDDGTVVIRPDEAGDLRITGNRSSTDAETFVADDATVSVQRRQIALSATVEPNSATAGENVTVQVRRADTESPVEATVRVANRSVETVAGRANLSVDAAGEYDLRVTKGPTRTERFVPAERTLTVERRRVGLSLVVDRPVTTAGGNVTARLRRIDDGTSLRGTVSVEGTDYETDSQGRVRVRLPGEGSGSVTLTGSAPPTESVAFEDDAATVDRSPGDIVIANASIPSTGASGEQINVSVTVENVAAVAAEDTIVYRVDGQRRDRTLVALEPGERTTYSTTLSLPDTAGRIPVVVSTGTDSVHAEVAVDGENSSNRTPLPITAINR